MDDETSLVYMKARFYDPDSSRFLTEDTYLGMQDTPPSLNRYLYAYSNPAKYIDPDGHCSGSSFEIYFPTECAEMRMELQELDPYKKEDVNKFLKQEQMEAFMQLSTMGFGYGAGKIAGKIIGKLPKPKQKANTTNENPSTSQSKTKDSDARVNENKSDGSGVEAKEKVVPKDNKSTSKIQPTGTERNKKGQLVDKKTKQYVKDSAAKKNSNPIKNEGVTHKNSNIYRGDQAVYEIKIDGKIQKYGKADNTDLAKNGSPNRLESQLKEFKKQNPDSKVEGSVIYKNKDITTKNIKKVETDQVQNYVDKYGKFPPGNQNHPGVKLPKK